MRVLIAEDEQDLNRIIAQKLTEDGYSVDTCYDGKEAIDILSYTDYDAVILDIMMPGADGLPCCVACATGGRLRQFCFLLPGMG